MNGGKLTIKDVTITNFFKSINQSGTKAGIITSNSKIDLNAVVLSNNGFVEILFDFCKNFLIILFFYIFALILLKTFEKFVI